MAAEPEYRLNSLKFKQGHIFLVRRLATHETSELDFPFKEGHTTVWSRK